MPTRSLLLLFLISLCNQFSLDASCLWGQEILPHHFPPREGENVADFIELLPGQASAGDKVQQDDRTIRIVKQAGKESDLCGLRLKPSAKDVFSMAIDLEIVQLAPPRSPSAQGLMLRLIPDSPDQSLVSVGLGATVRGEVGIEYFKGILPKPNEIQFTPLPFSAGSLALVRESNELVLMVSQLMPGKGDPVYREIKRFPVFDSAVKHVEVVAVRNDTSKVSCEYLISRIEFAGSDFYAQPPPSPPFWTEDRVYSALFWSAILFVLTFLVLRRQQLKELLVAKFG